MKLSRRIRLSNLLLIVGITVLIYHRVQIRAPESEKLEKAKSDEFVFSEDPILGEEIVYYTSEELQ
jgi:hypothetical protein